MAGVKEELAKKAETTKGETKLTKSMSIADLIKAMAPEIKKALPEVITPEPVYKNGVVCFEYHSKTERVYADEFPCGAYECRTVGIRTEYSIGAGILNSL